MFYKAARLLVFGSMVEAAVSGGLSLASMNEQVKEAQYAVRGPILARAEQLNAALQKGDDLPFEKTISCNIGNPQALKQRPLSFHRQVLSIVLYPEILEDGAQRRRIPADVIARAKKYMDSIPNVGAYSASQGIPAVREEVAAFIAERDGTDPPAIENLFLTNGASEGVRLLFTASLRAPKGRRRDGVLVPVPQYPLYSALTALADGTFVPYYLDEVSGWGLNADEVRMQLAKARLKNVSVRGLVVINPGNPTGNCLPEEDMREIVRLCAEEGLVLMADEVYQENVYGDRPFISFRKVATDLGHTPEYQKGGLQLVSFHSCSKGFLGECGLRGGYLELFGIPDDVRAELSKLASISLCSNTPGQLACGLMVQPPKHGDPSYPKYIAEKDAILNSLKRRAASVSEAFGNIEGMDCQPIAGALYAFPSIDLPRKFIAEAKRNGREADAEYCMRLLEATGIVCVPGSGFGQKEGTYHFRTTILPPEEEMPQVVSSIESFHTKLRADYA